MNPLDTLKEKISEIESQLNYTFSDKSLIYMAFTHRSFVNENRDITKHHNERLEFLGDSVLGLIVSDFLYHKLPSSREGNLSHLRACLVDASACVEYIQKLNISDFALKGKGEMQNEGKGRETILADLFEAIIGAIYLDGGMAAARLFFLGHFEEKINELVSQPQQNWKAMLQDYSQRKYQKPPDYEVIKEEGPDHLKSFHVIAKVGGVLVGEGVGASKKEAQQNAAEKAAIHLCLEDESHKK